MIEVASFSKCYETGDASGAAIAVDRLSFCVRPGQVLGLVGRNGAGKTTTLRSIAGIIPATEGKIRVHDFDLNDTPIEAKRKTAYVPDDPQLFEDLSVEQHLQFQSSVYGIEDPSDAIARLLDRFELTDKRHARADSLSRGMRQKLAICSAYLQEPAALLLDEPMTGLDPQAIRELKVSVTEQADQGVAVIISSHLLAMVESICSHILVLDRGRCKFHGTVEELHQTFNDSEVDAKSLEDAFFSALGDVDAAVHSEISGATISEDVPLNREVQVRS
ncbi:MAG: ABC transporter ATP-binding protein [Planctomycetota bacterium]